MEKLEKEQSFFAECVAQATRQRILDTVRARVAIARANREASKKYINKQTLKEDEKSNDIKKEDAAITEPRTGPDGQASQRGCHNEGSGPSSSGSIPTRELVPHHAEHGHRARARAQCQGQAPCAEAEG